MSLASQFPPEDNDNLMNDESVSQFDQSLDAGPTGSVDDIITPMSAQLSYRGRPVSQPAQRVFKLEDTNLLEYATTSPEKDLMAVVGVHTQDSAHESPLQPASPGGLTWKSLGKSQKNITQPVVDNTRRRPDVKRNEQTTRARDHEMMKTQSLASLRTKPLPKVVPEDPFDDPTGNLRNNALFPKRIDTFPTEESKHAKSTYMKQLKKLRKYKYGVPPDQRLKLMDKQLKQQVTPLGMLDPNYSSSIAHVHSNDSITEPTGAIDINLDINPPSPNGLEVPFPGISLGDEKSVHSTHSIEQAAAIVSPVLSTKKKEIVVKNVPEEKLGYYKRVGVGVNFPAEAAAPSTAASTAPSTANNSVAGASRGAASADTSAQLVSRLMSDIEESAIEAELRGQSRPLTNNPLQRYRMEQKTAERMSSREPIRCCKCSKDSSFWCRQCCLSYCHSCWSSIPHHGFVSTTGLPSPPSSAVAQDIPFSAFPALKKTGELPPRPHGGEEHSPVYSPTRSSMSRVGSTIRMLRQDKPFYKGLALSDDAINNIDLTLFGGLEGMKGNKQPRPRSGRAASPGEWRKPVQNNNNDRGMLVPKNKKKRKGKKVVINIPNLSAGQTSTGYSTLSLGTSGAPPLYSYPMTGITHDYFPEDWKDSRPNSDITVCKGVPVYTVAKEHLNKTV